MKSAIGRIEVIASTEREAREMVTAKLSGLKGQDFVGQVKIECAPHFCKDETSANGVSLGWLCLIFYKSSREYRADMARKEVAA